MSFAALKKRSNSKKDVNQMMEKLNAAAGAKQSFVDDRYWKLERDKSSNGYAIIRFLDSPEKEDFPFVKIYTHGFKGKGGWYIENSLTTIGQQDPVSEANSELWNSGIDSNKQIARDRKRRLQYISNIYVVQDQAHPENEGKVFLFKYGKSIFDMIQAAGEPQFEDESPVNVFNLFNGANFKLKARKADGFVKYDKSSFEEPSQWLKTEEEMETLYNGFYSLEAEIAEDKFKSYEELKKKFARVIGASTDTSAFTAESVSAPTSTMTESEDLPFDGDPDPGSTDDTMSYFSKLAEA